MNNAYFVLFVISYLGRCDDAGADYKGQKNRAALAHWQSGVYLEPKLRFCFQDGVVELSEELWNVFLPEQVERALF
jgi:hypothetical protein